MSDTTKKTAIMTLTDLVSTFAHYGRKDDEELSSDDVRDLLASGELTITEIADVFEKTLRANGSEVTR